jgi:Coenzyme PQQ synthesis protein D (PqqD)
MYRVAESVRSKHTQDGGSVLDVRQGLMLTLNPVGSRILEFLELGAAESAVIDEISQEFDVNREIVERDVQEFIANLKRHRILVDVGSSEQN